MNIKYYGAMPFRIGIIVLITCGLLILAEARTRLSRAPEDNTKWTANELITILEHNLDEDSAETNISLFERIDSDVFQSFDCVHQGRILHLMGVSHYYINDEYAAVRYFSRAAYEIWSECPDIEKLELANTIYNIGISYQYTPEVMRAKEHIDKAIAIYENTPECSIDELADKYLGAGNYYLEIKDHNRAEAYLKSALLLFEKDTFFRSEKFTILNQLLILYLEFHKFDEALNAFQSILKLPKEFNILSPSEKVIIFLNGAVAYLEKNQFSEAIGWCRQATQILPDHEIKLHSNIAEILGVIEKRRKKYDLSEKYLKRSLELRKSGSISQAYLAKSFAYENLSELYLEMGFQDRSLMYIDSALQSLIPGLDQGQIQSRTKSNLYLNNKTDLVRQLGIKSKILSAISLFDHEVIQKRIAIFAEIDTIIQQSISDLRFEGSKIELLQIMISEYGSAIQFNIDQYLKTNEINYLHKAYYFSARSKSLILQKHLNLTRTLESFADKDVLRQANQINRKLANVKEALLEKSEGQDSLLQSYVQVQLEWDLFNAKLEHDHPQLLRSRQQYSHIVAVDVLQESIDENQLIVEFFQNKDEMIIFWICKDTFFHTSASLKLLEEKVHSLLSSSSNPEVSFDEKIARKTFTLILHDGLIVIPEKINRICFIPDGSLYGVPFACLINDITGNYLIQDYILSQTYSGSMLFTQQNKKKHEFEFIGFGSNYSLALNQKLQSLAYLKPETYLESLTSAEQEVATSASLFRNKVFTGKEASLNKFMEKSPSAKIIYLSLHGLVDYNDASRSCIIFDDREQNFILSPTTLSAHRIDAELIILSSCHTASGQLFRGEGLNGMTRAFISSGAKNVISSLWNATELSSSNILSDLLRFYKRGNNTDEALQKATLRYLQKSSPAYRHPYYWANYILIGHLSHPYKNSSFKIWFPAVTLLILACLTILIIKRKHKNKPVAI